MTIQFRFASVQAKGNLFNRAFAFKEIYVLHNYFFKELLKVLRETLQHQRNPQVPA
jgi:hypothetical protein